jgi:hypothetical protein
MPMSVPLIWYMPVIWTYRRLASAARSSFAMQPERLGARRNCGIRGYELVFRDPRMAATKLHMPMHVQTLDRIGRAGAP